MQGGEIFIPKIPSTNITDLATSLAENLPQEIVGIRPGEKIHEVMCPSDDSHLTFEFYDHYVICPSITFSDSNVDFSNNLIKEKGESVAQGFEYNSNTNSHFLTIDELREFDKQAEL